MQLFLDSNDFDSELLKLKQRIKNILNECFIDIYLQCHYKTFDFFGNVIAPMEDEFLKFTRSNFIEWFKCLQCKEFTEYENEGLCYDCEFKNYRL